MVKNSDFTLKSNFMFVFANGPTIKVAYTQESILISLLVISSKVGLLFGSFELWHLKYVFVKTVSIES